MRIFVSVPLDQTVERARARDAAFTGTTEIERSWRHRYIPAQQRYYATAHPTTHADIIVHNTPFNRPRWEARP
ncbi:hypothetical protein [Actinokineospora diospyrosa]|uniref:hypothetical protein n=1 Tax=Actinokineospora diospyrosa TaxID=103728 RepID=UPI0020A42B2C|nr:hypothetical protein [Actinokineospora diospyrosa]